jgi:Xaa-Pro aminopeptidase
MIVNRLKKFRMQMENQKISAYIIPGTDAHQSEYLPDLWKRREYISGFTGSAGDVVVTEKSAGLWTDGRYYAQASQQLTGSGIDLYRASEKETPNIPQFLVQNLKEGDVVGIDPTTFSYDQLILLKKDLGQNGLKISLSEDNLVDSIWTDQPSLPGFPIKVHSLRFAGESVESKLQRLREAMHNSGSNVHILSALDAIAWLFNLRGNDVNYNPVFISYAIITLQEARLFAIKDKYTDEIHQHLAQNVLLYDYHDFKEELDKINTNSNKVWFDGSSVNYWIANRLDKCSLYNAPSPVIKFKAIKNETELKGFRECHVRDGVAMVNFLYWLEQKVPLGKVTEKSAAEKVAFFRSQQEMFQGPSFATISSYKIHGGIIHYTVTDESDIPLQPEGIYLIDSGGQYSDGTTDITRTISLGEPNSGQIDNFTRVLMGHINLCMVSFPKGSTGPALDTITRLPLWEAGKNFNHGTGHGVGSYLCVHEGPQSINPTKSFSVALEPGMICSNEPGFYKDGEYGMRIENLITVVRDDNRSDKGIEFYKFENATLCPIDTRLLNEDLMSPQQIQWLNDYHKNIWETLSPLLEDEVKKWLKKVTHGM